MSPVNHKLLHQCLDAFSASTGVPVTLYTPELGIQEEFLPKSKFCKFFKTYRLPGECGKNLQLSTQLSYEMGEPYIYYCPVGLVHIAVPVIVDEQYRGCAVAGPLAMGEVDERYLEKAVAMDGSAAGQMINIAMFLARMPQYTPDQVQKLSTLLYSAVLHSHKNWKDYDQLRSRHDRQLVLGEHIQKRKQTAPPPAPAAPTCAELEAQLCQELRSRDRDKALACLDALFNELILVEGGNFDGMKLRIFELYISFSRMASESGAPLRKIFGGDFKLINSLNGIETVEALAGWAREAVLHFIDEVLAGLSQISETTAQAVSYIAAHYMDKITLHELAGRLFVCDSYLSKLFRQDLGVSFTDYLNKARIEHGMELMQNTDLSLLEIASRVGFDDQSYFTKVFKRATGETPREYKKHVSEEKKEAS